MIEKIRLILLKIIFIRKRTLFLASLLVFSGIFLYAQLSQAFFDIPYNIAAMQLGGLDFIESSILKFLVLLLMLVLESAAFVFISALLLDWASALPVGLDNTLVDTGWRFTLGLANLSFIIIFIFIAFSYILKTENWGMKKALPRLIIIAILINFSLLFVQMITDMGWIAQNSFKSVFFDNKGGLAVAALTPLLDSSKGLVTLFGTALGGYVASVLMPVPFLSVIGQVALSAVVFTGEAATGMISQTILLILFNFLTGLIFLVYAILFLARIGVIWLLAIVAPLAFIASILPKTQKHFDEWLKALFQWTFLGVVAFFLMGLGIKMFGSFESGSGNIPEGIGGWQFPATYYKLIFLLIYLIVAFLTAKKWMPAGTEAAWNLTTMAANRGSKWAGEKMTRGLRQADAGARMIAAKTARNIQTRQQTGQRLSWQERMASPLLRQAKPELLEAQAKATERRFVAEQRSKILAKTKDMDEEGTKAVLRSELEKHKGSPTKDKNKSIALAELLIEKNAQKDGDKDFLKKIWTASGPYDIAKNPLKRDALKKMLHWADPGEMSILISRMNSADMDKLDVDAKKNPEVVRQIVSTMRADLINRLGSQNEEVFEKVQEQIEMAIGEKWRTAPDTLNKKELGMLRNLHLSAATTNLNWDTYGSLQEIEDRIKNFGRQPQGTTGAGGHGPGPTQTPPPHPTI